MCAGDLLSQRPLTLDSPEGFGRGETVSPSQAGNLRCSSGSDDDDLIHAFIDPGFEQERNVVNDDDGWVFPGGVLGQPDLLARDAGVDDPFKPASLGGIAEHDSPEGLSIHRSVGVENGGPELAEDLAPGRFVRFHDVARQQIGVDDHGPASLKHSRYRAFACCQSACQSNEEHGRGAYHATSDPTRNPD